MRWFAKGLVLAVGRDANDFDPGCTGIVQAQAFADWTLPRPKATRKGLVHDADECRARSVLIGKVTARPERGSHHVEVGRPPAIVIHDRPPIVGHWGFPFWLDVALAEETRYE